MQLQSHYSAKSKKGEDETENATYNSEKDFNGRPIRVEDCGACYTKVQVNSRQPGWQTMRDTGCCRLHSQLMNTSLQRTHPHKAVRIH